MLLTHLRPFNLFNLFILFNDFSHASRITHHASRFMQHLGLFGGSFDPIHLGHLLVAQAAREEVSLTRLFFIPVTQSPFKPESKPTPANERLRLLRLALAGKDWCEVDDQEIKRGGLSYTIDTVRDYARRFPQAELFYLVGADHVPQ